MSLRILPKKGEMLEIGTNGKGEVSVFHPFLEGGKPVIFSPEQAKGFAWTLEQKARDAEAEVAKVKV